MATVLRTALWIGAVDALGGAALLGFLHTPEANVLMLAASVLLVALAAALLVLSSASAAHGVVHHRAPWASLGAAVRHLPLILFTIVLLGMVCGGAGWFERWWMANAGQVDAAAIAAGDITRTGWLHTAVHWIVVLIQWVLVPAWLATALAWAAGYERRDVLTLKWLTAGLHWRLVLVTLAGVVLLVWLPWRWVYWRPKGLPATTVELVFTATKLVVIYALSQVAWALSIVTAARAVPPPAGVVAPPASSGTPPPPPPPATTGTRLDEHA
ncbi:hypothetical protein TBR22_A22230 [Luteitalea sp. TBR-22]|uniref:hypothetical protein n=1 Tax=Luteitalea sp. TBR-22 TaxID=2802971 RepID=UPI001EF466F4|nr:hypothetical protein [Luteitalea sp. TBR-22]BCS32998.2 hypothetical protein TBR22_A22230 [Luteitalea sp. TBR-22]